MNQVWIIFKRELASYFATPLAFVFIVVFLFATGIFTFYIGDFFRAGRADLQAFFVFHPWLYLFLIPAISMRLWAEERKSGTLEILLTLPIPIWAVVVGKFLAAWVFAGIALALTFPVWISVNVLGDPDNGVVIASYVGSFLLAGGYLAVGAALSSMTSNQVIAFVVTVVVCFLFMASGLPLVLDALSSWAPQFLINTVASFSFLSHFQSIQKGVIDLRDLAFFAALIGFWLFVNTILIEQRKAG